MKMEKMRIYTGAMLTGLVGPRIKSNGLSDRYRIKNKSEAMEVIPDKSDGRDYFEVFRGLTTGQYYLLCAVWTSIEPALFHNGYSMVWLSDIYKAYTGKDWRKTPESGRKRFLTEMKALNDTVRSMGKCRYGKETYTGSNMFYSLRGTAKTIDDAKSCIDAGSFDNGADCERDWVFILRQPRYMSQCIQRKWWREIDIDWIRFGRNTDGEEVFRLYLADAITASSPSRKAMRRRCCVLIERMRSFVGEVRELKVRNYLEHLKALKVISGFSVSDGRIEWTF